jgi:hypothetical protein
MARKLVTSKKQQPKKQETRNKKYILEEGLSCENQETITGRDSHGAWCRHGAGQCPV